MSILWSCLSLLSLECVENRKSLALFGGQCLMWNFSIPPLCLEKKEVSARSWYLNKPITIRAVFSDCQRFCDLFTFPLIYKWTPMFFFWIVVVLSKLCCFLKRFVNLIVWSPKLLESIQILDFYRVIGKHIVLIRMQNLTLSCGEINFQFQHPICKFIIYY